MQDRTEPPTQRKLRKARLKGKVPFSQDLASALFLGGGIFLLIGFSNLLSDRLKTIMTHIFSNLSGITIREATCLAIFSLLWPLGAILAGLLLLAISLHFLQKGWVWGWNREKKIFSSSAFEGGFGRLIFNILKIGALCGAGFLVSPIGPLDIFLIRLALITVALLVFVGLADCFFQRWKFYRQQRMTKEEVRQEKKESEGNAFFKRGRNP